MKILAIKLEDDQYDIEYYDLRLTSSEIAIISRALNGDVELEDEDSWEYPITIQLEEEFFQLPPTADTISDEDTKLVV